jgi:hypothetical protein
MALPYLEASIYIIYFIISGMSLIIIKLSVFIFQLVWFITSGIRDPS